MVFHYEDKTNFPVAAPQTAVYVITVLMWCLCLGMTLLFLCHPEKNTLVNVAVSLFLFGVILVCWLLAPRSYVISSDHVQICRRLFSLSISRNEITGVALVEPKALRGAIRVCGIGGLYSCTGWFYKRGVGFFRAYVTDSKKTVIFRAGKRIYVVSPADPAAFIECLQRSTY